jgi:adenine-specific DNA-methyltransferase
MLIHGDNLLALKALEQDFAGRIKCIYIDPPFNTGQAFEHYDDGLEHSIWLTMMRDRLVLLRALLRPEGTIFVHIDDNELGYLLALMDEIFGRRNFVAACTFKQGAATGHKAINPGLVTVTNFVLVYAKDKSRWQCNRLFISRERDRRYTQFILNRNAPYPEWAFTTLRRAFAQSLGLPEREAKNQLGADYEERLEGFVLQNAASVIRTARPDYEGVGEAARAMIDRSKGEPTKVLLLQRDAYPDMYFLGGERILFYADKLKKIDGQLVPGEPLTTLWDDVLSNNLHNEGGVDLNRTT